MWEDSVFEANEQGPYSARLSGSGGGALYVGSGQVRMARCTFRGNRALVGGAVMQVGGVLELEACLLTSNLARSVDGVGAASGGALYLGGGQTVLSNGTLLVNNSALNGSSVAHALAADHQRGRCRALA